MMGMVIVNCIPDIRVGFEVVTMVAVNVAALVITTVDESASFCIVMPVISASPLKTEVEATFTRGEATPLSRFRIMASLRDIDAFAVTTPDNWATIQKPFVFGACPAGHTDEQAPLL
jgi:hypothetical protein